MFVKRQKEHEAELDITAFMNLMIVLVPVLLMSMVFKHITILQLNLPDLNGAQVQSQEEDRSLEVILRKSQIEVYYPSGVLIKKVKSKDGAENAGHDYETLSLVLQEIKRSLKNNKADKQDVLLLSDSNVDYQMLVSTMDTLRGFKTVVAAEAVDVELFPEISLGDAPVMRSKG